MHTPTAPLCHAPSTALPATAAHRAAPWRAALLASALAMGAAASAHAALIQVTGDQVSALAGSPNGSDSNGANVTGFGTFTAPATFENNNAYLSLTTSTAAGGDAVDGTLRLSHTSSHFASAQVSAVVYFVALANARYDLSGQLVQTGTGELGYDLELREANAGGASLFHDAMISNQTPQTTYDLGSPPGGVNFSSLTGSMSGQLVAGTVYALAYSAYVNENTLNNADAANGFFRLSVTDLPVTPAVPEPNALALVALGLAAVGASRLRRQR